MENKIQKRFAASLVGRITMMFIVLAAVIESLFLVYWITVLEPSLERGIESSIRSLAQSQTLTLSVQLSDPKIEKEQIIRLLDNLLLLKDPITQTPLILALQLEMDYDVIDARPGSLDLIRPKTTEIDLESKSYKVEVPIFSNQTQELLGIAKFYGSKAFFLNVRKDVRNGFYLETLCILPLLFLSWWFVLLLLRPLNMLVDTLRSRGGDTKENLPELKGIVSDEVRLVKTELDNLFTRIREYTTNLASLNEELEQRVNQRTIQLAAANKELEAFSYSVSHDLRAPLRHIDGFSLALMEDCFDQLDDGGKDYINRIRRSCHRMSDLINALLVLSRIGRQEMMSDTVNLSLLVSEISKDLKKDHPDRKVQFNISPSVVTQGDKRLLRVLIENLMGNAWKFSAHKEKTEIEFGVIVEMSAGKIEHVEEKVYFIRDNGVGFDMTYENKLFKAFQRLHTESEFAGTGIGLATVRRIVNRHGGHVWAEGQVNKGAVFYFTLGTNRFKYKSTSSKGVQ